MSSLSLRTACFLPDEVLRLPRLGCLNIHPSLLPRHRGPSPVATAILDGDETSGVTIMLLDEGMDTGPILAQRETRISADETTEELTERLFELGSELLVDTLDQWERGQIVPTPQNDEEASVTRRLEREDGRIDWSQSADSIARAGEGHSLPGPAPSPHGVAERSRSCGQGRWMGIWTGRRERWSGWTIRPSPYSLVEARWRSIVYSSKADEPWTLRTSSGATEISWVRSWEVDRPNARQCSGFRVTRFSDPAASRSSRSAHTNTGVS